MANANTLSFGPGLLYEAPVTTVAPVTLSEELNAAWKPIGYTNEGSELSFEIETDPVEVAEELEPLFYRTTGRNGSVSFEMVENTARNLAIAFNGGDVKTDTTSKEVTYTPPEPGQETRRALLWVSEDGEEVWHYPQVFQGGSVSIARRKGAEKASLPVEMRLEKRAGEPLFTAILHGDRSGEAPVTP